MNETYLPDDFDVLTEEAHQAYKDVVNGGKFWNLGAWVAAPRQISYFAAIRERPVSHTIIDYTSSESLSDAVIEASKLM